MRLVTCFIIIAALSAGSAGLAAQGKGKGKAAQSNADGTSYASDHGNSVAVNVSFGSNDQRVIQTWFAEPQNMKGLPPGLAKKETLPPGLQQHLARNGQLPPGLQKRIQPLPPALEVKLSPLPEGRRRVFINGNILLLDERKNLILDVLAVF